MHFRKIFKSVFIAGLILCGSFSAFAQGAYVKINVGYNFGNASASGANYKANYIRDLQTGAIIGGEEKAELVKINYGKGITGSAALGYMFSKNLGVELDISYLHGGKNKTNSTSNVNDRSFSEQVYKFNASAKMIYLQPSIVFSTELKGPLSAYGKFGIIIAKGIIYENNYSFYQDSVIEASEVTFEKQYRGGWGFGLMAGLGLNCKLNEKFSLFSEVKINSLSYAPNRYKFEKITVNGETYPTSNPVGLVQEYSKNFSTQISNQSTEEIKQAFPFSSAGLNFGLKINL